jgi:FkbM family methyltransferase
MMDPIVYETALGQFRTPKGNPLPLWYRIGTNDWNTANASATEDEYHLRDLPTLTGVAVDIGGYLGSVGIALAIDHPGLRVVIVEPVPENAELIARNIAENNVSRIELLPLAAAAPSVQSTTVRYRYRGSELADHHAFVGNISLIEGTGATDIPHDEQIVACVSLSAITAIYGPIAFLKIDCEGCEWSALDDPTARETPLIIGEWHPTGGKTQADLVALLGTTHDLTFEGPIAGPQEFTAVRRAAFGPLVTWQEQP